MERFISLVKRGNFDYTEWQRNLWQNETIESLTEKAQKNWEKKYGHSNSKKDSGDQNPLRGNKKI
jgi:hypothetical protein